MRTIERHLQQCLNKIENWALFTGFKFSKNRKHNVSIFVNLENYMIIRNYIYTDLSFQLLMKRNFLMLFLTENFRLFLIFNI